LRWAFSEAACLFLRRSRRPRQVSLSFAFEFLIDLLS
jgi:hypothetical protein